MSNRLTLLAISVLNTLSGCDYASADSHRRVESMKELFRLILDIDMKSYPEQIRIIRESLKSPTDLSLLYEQLLSVSDKKAQGIFYTPPPAIELLVDLVLDGVEVEWNLLPKVLDPACGSGMILLRVAEYLAQKLFRRTAIPIAECRRHIVENCIFGIDIDPVACMIAEYSLKNYCGQNVTTHIVNKDALLQPVTTLFPIDFDAVITNPPYVGERGHTELFQKYYANPYISRYCEGKMDLWYLFVHLSLNSTQKIVGVLVTDYWEYAKGARLLRERLKTHSHTLYSFRASLFKDAPGVHSQIMLLNTTSQARYALKEEFRPICSQIPSFTRDMFIPEPPRRTSRPSKITLGEITQISQGVVAGPDRISARYMRRFEGLSLGAPVFVLPKDHLLLTELSEVELQVLKPFAYPRQLRPVVARLEPEHRIIDIRGSESEVYRDYPSILKHLQQYKSLLQSRRETLRGVRRWYELHWPRRKDCFVGRRIVSVRQTKSPVFCLLETECYFDLGVNIIKTPDEELLEVLAVYLHTQTVRDFLRTYGKMKGEIFQIDSEQLKAIPVPEALLSASEMRYRFKSIYQHMQSFSASTSYITSLVESLC